MGGYSSAPRVITKTGWFGYRPPNNGARCKARKGPLEGPKLDLGIRNLHSV
jgi:hypothetical protein